MIPSNTPNAGLLSPELESNTEHISTSEVPPVVLEGFLLQALAPSVRASQERERQQRGTKMKISMRARSRLENNFAVVQNQQEAHNQLSHHIQSERDRQQAVLASKMAALVTRHVPKFTLYTIARILLTVSRLRRKVTHTLRFLKMARKPGSLTCPDLAISRTTLMLVQVRAVIRMQACVRMFLVRHRGNYKYKQSRNAREPKKSNSLIVGRFSVMQEEVVATEGFVPNSAEPRGSDSARKSQRLFGNNLKIVSNPKIYHILSYLHPNRFSYSANPRFFFFSSIRSFPPPLIFLRTRTLQ